MNFFGRDIFENKVTTPGINQRFWSRSERTGHKPGLIFKTTNRTGTRVFIFWGKNWLQTFVWTLTEMVPIYFLEPELELLHKCKEPPKLVKASLPLAIQIICWQTAEAFTVYSFCNTSTCALCINDPLPDLLANMMSMEAVTTFPERQCFWALLIWQLFERSFVFSQCLKWCA